MGKARTPKPPRYFPEFCDDIVGKRREEIVRDHLDWVRSGGQAQHEKDFSDAPIAKWLGKHKEALATQRAVASSYYKNTKIPRER